MRGRATASVRRACGVLNEQQQPCLRGTAATAHLEDVLQKKATALASRATTAPAGRLPVRNGRAATLGGTILRDYGTRLMGEGSARQMMSTSFYWSTTKLTGATRIILLPVKFMIMRVFISTLRLG